MRPRLLLAVLALASGWLLGACSSDDASPSTTVAGCAQVVDGKVTLVAKDLAYDADCIDASPGDVTIVLQNDDEGVNHNIHLPDLPDSPATDLHVGPATDELPVTLPAGDVEFVCDLHSNMVGTIHVTDASSTTTPP
jgi:plastocyanin